MALPSETQTGQHIDPKRYQVGEVIAGKYRIDALIGEGGMGAVYRAFNLQLEAPVAIKLLRPRDDRDVSSRRLKQEAKAAAKLGHPAIVRVFDVGESAQGDPFIVMELLEGLNLAALIARDQRLGAQQAVQLLLPVADALAMTHARGIIHRDLKPDNVFIAAEGDQLQPKLVDFGIVKLAGEQVVDTHLTQPGSVLGSPEYLSPEQARGQEDVDLRTDIWSFCVVLYEAVTGLPPFVAQNYNALLRGILEDEPRPLNEHLAGDDALWAIVRRGLAKDRDARFRSMGELGRALAGWLVSRGVHEDVCGASLDVKWLNRSSDPAAQRASLSSIADFQPVSGIRSTLNPDPRKAASALDETIDSGARQVAPRTSAGRKRRSLAIAGASLLVLVALLAAYRRSQQPSATPQVPQPSAASQPVRPLEPSLMAALPATSPVASSAAVQSAAAEASSRPAPASVRKKALTAATRPDSSAKPAHQNDLLSPY
ncbi:MAG TPA: serine/threonine-protein kinase [Polyangiaceae bacterium]|jgi:serine/threonine-protein kinase